MNYSLLLTNPLEFFRILSKNNSKKTILILTVFSILFFVSWFLMQIVIINKGGVSDTAYSFQINFNSFNIFAIYKFVILLVISFLTFLVASLVLAGIIKVLCALSRLNISFQNSWSIITYSLISVVLWMLIELILLILFNFSFAYLVYFFYAYGIMLIFIGISVFGELSKKKFRTGLLVVSIILVMLLAIIITLTSKEKNKIPSNFKFYAEINNEVVFTEDDIISVCTSSSCSNVDSQSCFETGVNSWICYYDFRINLSDSATRRLYDVVNSLSVEQTNYALPNEKPDYRLNGTITYYFGNIMIGESGISADLKGTSMNNAIVVSGDVTESTKNQALEGARHSLIFLQNFLQDKANFNNK